MPVPELRIYRRLEALVENRCCRLDSQLIKSHAGKSLIWAVIGHAL